MSAEPVAGDEYPTVQMKLFTGWLDAAGEAERQSTGLFLAADDLHELTGFVRPSKQIEWLKREGFAFRVAADGHPRVLREHVSRLLDPGSGAKKAKAPTEPNFSTMA